MNASPPRLPAGIAALAVAAIAAAAFFVGFYVLPGGGNPQLGWWQRVCRAAGYVATPVRDAEAAPPGLTTVVLPPSALRRGTPDEIGRGATLSLRCTGCHGARGLSGANAPNLAGQYAEVVYKELLDFQRGARTDAVMGAMAASLSDANMLDLAHYYAFLPRPGKDRLSDDAPALVRVGDPMRNIAPCTSCHGDRDGKVGAPALEGEPKTYLVDQLNAFASGSRKNDANSAMRNEARGLTAAEISRVTDHYSGAAP
jgi:cytochrome c553